VIGPTRRGYGQSLPKPRDYPVDFYHRDANDMLAVMESLNIEKAHVLGFSDGGETALIMAALAPDKFERVVVWGAVGYYAPSMRAVIQRNYPATWMSQEIRDLNGLEDQAAADALVLGWINAVKQMIDAGGDVSVSLAPGITAPVLMLLGEGDTLNPASSAQVFLDRVPNGRLEMFPCGHRVHEEKWDDFRRVVGEFLGIRDIL
jgi:valacyclovir hydrolase